MSGTVEAITAPAKCDHFLSEMEMSFIGFSDLHGTNLGSGIGILMLASPLASKSPQQSNPKILMKYQHPIEPKLFRSDACQPSWDSLTELEPSVFIK
jgi:hypothetical protein